MNSAPSNGEIYDIVIVGAGPVGLLAARGAARRGCKRICVLEQARNFTKAGVGLDLQANGIRALKKVAPKVYESLDASHPVTESSPWPIYDHDGTLIHTIVRQTDAERTFSIEWYILQRSLLDDCDTNIEIRRDAAVTSLHSLSEHVSVTYMTNRPRHKHQYINWEVAVAQEEEEVFTVSPEEHQITARVVIGADGIHSRCRREIYRAMGGEDSVRFALPVYVGLMFVRVSVDEIPAGTENYFAEIRSKLSGAGTSVCSISSRVKLPNRSRLSRCILLALPADKFMLVFVIFASESLDSQPTLLLKEIYDIVATEISYQPVRDVTKSLAEDYDSSKIRVESRPLWTVPLFQHEGADLQTDKPPDLVRPFAYQRIFLAGDALHGCPNIMAQGTAMGLEDVCELVDLLANAFNWSEDEENEEPSVEKLEEVAESYRNARIERLKSVVESSSFPKPMNNISDYLAQRKYLLEFKPVASGWDSLP